MNRCLDCNGLLTKEETVCIQCGAKVPGAKKSMDGRRMASRAASFLFLGSLGVTVFGLFTENGVSVVSGVLLSCAMGLIRRSLRELPGESFSRQ
jgi:hypothetical protein